MPASQIVLIDANVLFSRTLRDWVALLYFESSGSAFRARYTEDIMSETMYSLRRKYPDWPGERILAIRRQLEKTFEGGLVEEYAIDPDFSGKDIFDAHVHSAALACGAHIVLTDNDKDLIPQGVDPDELPYEIWAPDDFFMLINESNPDLVKTVTACQLEYFMAHCDDFNMADSLRKAGAPKFANCVCQHLQTIPIPSVSRIGHL